MRKTRVLLGLFISLGMAQSLLAKSIDRKTIDFFDPKLPSCSTESFDRFIDLTFGVTPCGSKQCFVWTAAQGALGLSPYSYMLTEGSKQTTIESNRYRYELELSARIALANYLSTQPVGAKENRESSNARNFIYYEKYETFENSTPVANMKRTVDLSQANFTNFAICSGDLSYKFIGVIEQ